jgi:predicted nucleic acid-binding protein
VGSLALDASVTIALFSEVDAHHAQAVADVNAAADRDDELLMAASAYSEILVHALRQGRGDFVDKFIDQLRVEIVPVDRGIAHRAAELRAEHGALRLPDALVLATAQLRDAQLLTFDDRLSQLYS